MNYIEFRMELSCLFFFGNNIWSLTLRDGYALFRAFENRRPGSLPGE